MQRVLSRFLLSVALVAVATIVLFSLASISQLSKATPGGSVIDNSLLDNKVIGTVISYPNRNASPVSAQIKSPSSSEADNTPPSTLVPALSGMRNEEIVAEPALILTPDRKASVTAIESSHGSTEGPSNIETAPQEASALPASTADTASATAIETSHASTQGPSHRRDGSVRAKCAARGECPAGIDSRLGECRPTRCCSNDTAGNF